MKKLLLLLFVFSLWSCQEKTEQPEVTRETVLLDLAKAETLDRLKSPSTATFIDSLSTITKLKGEGDDQYRVNVSVDAENSFGAMGRERYMLIYQDKTGDSLSKENYELLNFYD
ncbi:hypothetical protein SAMN06296241_1396 [Salinimicrobium sediminis]|uniref:Uncharacterized protein n=1 Tax=Salinimicrobium sediminis TaxID=1343891 RepID=A0A285X3J4_9FLAO|nr:hypothetical protein [Salinimicrobium sediminis]SOC79858.1 hypothetical protein SAMN06296241_1396 [Salinimicrobium sediminis]